MNNPYVTLSNGKQELWTRAVKHENKMINTEEWLTKTKNNVIPPKEPMKSYVEKMMPIWRAKEPTTGYITL